MNKPSTSGEFNADKQQSSLPPQYLGDLIGANDLVRVVNDLVDQMDIVGLVDLYKVGGASSYSPRVMLKVLLYAYSVKIYTGRQIAAAI